MNRAEALSILNLTEKATKEQIKESYHKLRSFFYPAYYGQPQEFTPQQIQEKLYQNLSGLYYKETKKNATAEFVDDAYHKALYHYAKVCQAYDYLTELEKDNEEGLDPRSAYGYDVQHYGKTVANIRKTATAIASRLVKPVIIGFLVCWIIGLMVNREGNVFSIVAEILKYGFIATAVVNLIMMPLDMLLMIPKMLWSGVQIGASIGPWYTKLFTVILGGALGAVVGVLSMILFPGAVAMARESRYDPPIKNQKEGREAARVLYEKTVENMTKLGDVALSYPISDDEPVIRKALEKLSKEYKDALRELKTAQSEGDEAVERAEKNLSLEDKIQWNVEGAEDAYDAAWKNSRREVAKKAAIVKEKEVLLQAFVQRANGKLKDYAGK